MLGGKTARSASSTAPGRSFLLGANLPWLSYGCDFGASAWHSEGGLAQPAARETLDDVCGRLADMGVEALRWFALCDLRSGVRFDGDARPLGLDGHVFADMAAALDVLDRRDIGVVFSLFDFHLCGPRKRVRGVQTGGRAALVADADLRSATVECVVVPLLECFGDADRVLAWEVMNEPEWVTSGYGKPILGTQVPRRAMRAFLRDTVAAIHDTTDKPATVGSASRRWLDLVADLDLDFFQVHWYDKIDTFDDLTQPVAEWAHGAKVVLGEFPTKGSAQSPAALLEAAWDAGFDGAFAWSVLGDDEASDRAVIEAVYRAKPLPIQGQDSA